MSNELDNENDLESQLTNKYYINEVKCQKCASKINTYLKDRIPTIVNIKFLPELQRLHFEIPDNYIPDHIQSILDEIGDYTLIQHRIINNPTKCDLIVGKLKQFYPLLLIATYLSTSVVLYYYHLNITWVRAMDIWMGLFYLVFSFFKLLNLDGFIKSFRKYDILAKCIWGYALLYPFVEIFLAYMYLTDYYTNLANIITISVFSENILGVILAIYKKQTLHCACLGSILSLPLTTVTIIEDILMISMGFIGLIYH